MIEFSTNKPKKNKHYVQRVGAYAVIGNSEGAIALIKTKTGYFLPGGGLEKEESPEECLKRECLEEMGAEIFIGENFARGNCYFYSTTLNADMESVGIFFKCAIKDYLNIDTEIDHELVWLSLDQAIKLMYLENQRESLKIFGKAEKDAYSRAN